MAATQASLHQFYKARRSARDTSSKNVKGGVLREVVSVEKDILEVNKEEKVTNGESAITQPRSGRSLRATRRIKKEDGGSQDILAALRKAAEKVDNKATTKVTDRLEETTLPVTPKRKQEEDEDAARKRRKDGREEEDENTPKAPGASGVVPKDAPKSAKKKLNMGPSSPMKAPASPKKLTPAEIKERLGKCGRLDQLRAKLLKVNQCDEKIRQFKEKTSERRFEPPSPAKRAPHPQLEKFGALDVEVPISPSKKTPIKTPTKTPIKAPAFERYQHLVAKPSDELVLPYKYKFLKEVFRAVDTVVSLLHNRQEVITYSKLKPAVQEMMRKAFDENHLGQIKTVFPLAYIFKQEKKKKTPYQDAKEAKKPYDLTVSCNLDYKAAAQNLLSRFDEPPRDQPKFRKMDSVVMIERRNIFHNSLIDIIRDHHSDFLKTLDPPIISTSRTIKRWHPEFPLEELPPVDPSPLPQPPQVETLGTAKDVLSKAQDLFSVNARMEKAVAEAAAKVVEAAPESTPEPPKAPTNAALKGVSSSLLEKIRAREAAKAAREMTRTTNENKELEMLSRLPEMARIIRNTFVTEKKAALAWDVVASKVVASYPSMLGGSEVDTHLNLLIKEVPGWCTVHLVRSGKFLKINKNQDLSTVEQKLQEVIKQRK